MWNIYIIVLSFDIALIKKVRLYVSWQRSDDRESIDSSQFVTSIRQQLHITSWVFSLFFINVPMREHQSRPFFLLFSVSTNGSWTFILFRACNLRFSSNRKCGIAFENVHFHLSGLFLHCRGSRKNPYSMIKKKTKKRPNIWLIVTDPKSIFIHLANDKVYSRRKLSKDFVRSDFLGLMFLIAYISSRIVGKEKVEWWFDISRAFWFKIIRWKVGSLQKSFPTKISSRPYFLLYRQLFHANPLLWTTVNKK